MTGFDGFPHDAVIFLRDLKEHNDRDWFAANKDRYETALKRPARVFADAMAAALDEMAAAPHQPRIYRIHRDLRFARDKTPYNAHLHIAFAGQTQPGAWMFGLEPERIVFGAGVFAFDKPGLERYRARLLGADGEVLSTLLSGLKAEGARLDPPELKRPPPGFDAEHPRADLARRKGVCVWLDDGDPFASCEAGFLRRARDRFERLAPVMGWLARRDQA